MPNVGFILAPFAYDDVYGEEILGALSSSAQVLQPIATKDDVAHQRVPWLAEVDFLFTSWGAPVLDQTLLEQMPRLQAVFFGAGSVRDMVTDAFWEREITLTSAAAVNARPVAEFSLAAILFGLKRVLPQARTVQRLRGHPHPPLATPGVYRSTVGLVSFGQIGRQLRELLRAFDVRVLVYDPFVSNAELLAADVEPASLETLFAESDVVSLHTPWLPSTEGLITGSLIARMKPGATLINTARGAVVREDELVTVLLQRTDLQAILDVTWPEPPEEKSLLYDLPNVLLTPHIAGSIGRERRRIGAAMLAEYERLRRGEPLLFAVNRAESLLRA